jgi:hypothetical protein
MRKLDDQLRRHEAITALFTKEEKQQIVKAALKRGLAPSLLVRRAALEVAEIKEGCAA